MWPHKSTPDSLTVIDHIKSQCDWDAAVSAVGSRFEPLTKAPINLSADNLLREVNELYREIGAVSWASQPTLNLYGLSLNCNPDHHRDTWKLGSFGNIRYQVHSSYDYYKAVNADNLNRVKGDYLDSLGFRGLLPEVIGKRHLKSLFDSFKVPVVRSTARTLNGSLCFKTLPGDGGLHTDDSPFEVMRINICLSSNGDFGLQYLDHEPTFSMPGENLVINTDVPHRSYIKSNSEYLRTHLIIGVTPWLHYDAQDDTWSLNEYFGKIHPYDMVKQGLII
jgi:hypothetical protein